MLLNIFTQESNIYFMGFVLSYVPCCGSQTVLDPYSEAVFIRNRITFMDPEPHMQKLLKMEAKAANLESQPTKIVVWSHLGKKISAKIFAWKNLIV